MLQLASVAEDTLTIWALNDCSGVSYAVILTIYCFLTVKWGGHLSNSSLPTSMQHLASVEEDSLAIWALNDCSGVSYAVILTIYCLLTVKWGGHLSNSSLSPSMLQVASIAEDSLTIWALGDCSGVGSETILRIYWLLMVKWGGHHTEWSTFDFDAAVGFGCGGFTAITSYFLFFCRCLLSSTLQFIYS